jgi:Tol biopolymer transport system component
MKNIYLRFSFLLIVMLFSCSEEKVDGIDFGSVSGRVVKADTFEPVSNAKVFSNPSSSIVFTDADGRFTIPNVKTGQYSFQAQKDGFITKFEAVTVNIESNTEVVFELDLSTTNNRPPDTPILVSPEDNVINQNLQVELTWTGNDVDLDSLKYEVTLRNDVNDDIVIYSDIEEEAFTLTNLSFGTKYFWQVAANDGINPPVLSAVRSFTTTTFPLTRFLFVKKLSDNNVIYAGDESGNQVQLTSSDANSWRPRRNTQSNKIAFIRSMGSQNHIYTMNPDGSGIFRVTNSVPIAGFNPDYLNFSWNTSGSQLLYANFDKLYKINTDGSGLTLIYQTPNGKFISECDWSNDGSKIALKVNNANGYSCEVYVIDMTGNILNQVVSGFTGAIGGLNFSVTGQKLIFTRDISGFEDQTYRQLDTRIFQHILTTGITSEINVERPSGTVDLDVRYAPNEAELIFVNTSNDFLSVRRIQKYTVGLTTARVTLFTNATMPDWE